MPEALFSGVFLDQGELAGGAAGELQVGEGLVVDREPRGGRAELGAHVGDRRAVGDWEVSQAGAVELDQLADDTVRPEAFGDRQYQVRCRGAGRERTGQPYADDRREHHRHRLAEHRRLGLDAADPPAQYTESVHHRGVRIRPQAEIREDHAVAFLDHAGEVLEVDLVHDARAGRDHLQLFEGLLTPTQEAVSLGIAVILQIHVQLQRIRSPEHVRDHGVVDHQLRRDHRIHLRHITTGCGHGIPHRREIRQHGHPVGVMQKHPRRKDLDLPRHPRPPVTQGTQRQTRAASAFSRRIRSVRGRCDGSNAPQAMDLARTRRRLRPTPSGCTL